MTNMTPEELREKLESLNIKICTQDGVISRYLANESIDDILQLFTDLCNEVIGPDVPIYSEGKLVKRGDIMTVDLSGGIDDERFRESCRNIQENGRNLEKTDARTRLSKLTGKEPT